MEGRKEILLFASHCIYFATFHMPFTSLHIREGQGEGLHKCQQCSRPCHVGIAAVAHLHLPAGGELLPGEFAPGVGERRDCLHHRMLFVLIVVNLRDYNLTHVLAECLLKVLQ